MNFTTNIITGAGDNYKTVTANTARAAAVTRLGTKKVEACGEKVLAGQKVFWFRSPHEKGGFTVCSVIKIIA